MAIRVITSVKPATVNKHAAISKNSLEALDNSGVFRKPMASRTSNRDAATKNRIGQIAFTWIGIGAYQPGNPNEMAAVYGDIS
jgi:hypothetical protein